MPRLEERCHQSQHNCAVLAWGLDMVSADVEAKFKRGQPVAAVRSLIRWQDQRNAW